MNERTNEILELTKKKKAEAFLDLSKASAATPVDEAAVGTLLAEIAGFNKIIGGLDPATAAATSLNRNPQLQRLAQFKQARLAAQGQLAQPTVPAIQPQPETTPQQ